MAQVLLKELGVDDLYEFLGVPSTASSKDITRAYRRKALKYHPDKNPDNPLAADMFQKLSRVYGALCDTVCKAKYDQWLRARDAAKRRTEELDVKRRKLKEKLERNEGSFAADHGTELYTKAEVNRLRDLGKKMIEIQTEELRKRQSAPTDEDPVLVEVTWSKAGPGNYTQEMLEEILNKYGHIEHIIMSKKRSLALVEFSSVEDAGCAVASEDIGHDGNPLVIRWRHQPDKPLPSVKPMPSSGTEETATQQDYESIVLARLHRAEEQRGSSSHQQ